MIDYNHPCSLRFNIIIIIVILYKSFVSLSLVPFVWFCFNYFPSSALIVFDLYNGQTWLPLCTAFDCHRSLLIILNRSTLVHFFVSCYSSKIQPNELSLTLLYIYTLYIIKHINLFLFFLIVFFCFYWLLYNVTCKHCRHFPFCL